MASLPPVIAITGVGTRNNTGRAVGQARQAAHRLRRRRDR
jgi:hypothetical protein